ncbi:HVA22-like protein k [Chlorella vulgaris]
MVRCEIRALTPSCWGGELANRHARLHRLLPSAVALRSTCVGLVYPAYRSLKAVEARPPNQQAINKWLIYFSVYGLMTAAERPLDSLLQWVPYFHAVKVVLLVWLQSSSYEGAQRLYREGLRPWLATWQPSIDDFLASLLRALRRPELLLVAEGLHVFCSKTPVLEWFVRGPNGRPQQRRPAFITDGRSSPDEPWRRR